MSNLIPRVDKSVLLVVLLILSALLVLNEYFPEATFELASESRLPKWITLPPGLTRADVSLTFSYYTLPWNDAKFILQDKNKQTIEKKNGRVKCRGPFQLKNPPQGFPSGYPNYEAVTVNGITEIIEQRKPEPALYVTDDPIVWKQYESIGC
jgi:hypothetical protein